MATTLQVMEANTTQIRTTSGIDVLAGLWLIVAPFILNYSGTTGSIWNDVLLGIAIAGFAGIQALEGRSSTWASWINTFLGIWLIAVPFILGFTSGSAAMWNDVVTGSVVTLLSVFAIFSITPEM